MLIKRKTCSTSTNIRKSREIALSKRHMKISERLTEPTKLLPELVVGDKEEGEEEISLPFKEISSSSSSSSSSL